jgi:membrane-bound lytic murein transglycosylase D
MARRVSRLYGGVLALAAGVLSACSTPFAPATLQGFHPLALESRGEVQEPVPAGAPIAPTGPAAAAPAPSPPPPMALAMQRATAHYEHGVRALRSGDPRRAETEFDAALENLLPDGGAGAQALVARAPQAVHPDWGWLSGLVRPARPLPPSRTLRPPGRPTSAGAPTPAERPPAAAAPGDSAVPHPQESAGPGGAAPSSVAAPLDGEEPSLDAPALITPEDFGGDAASAALVEPIPVPEPDVTPSDFPVVVNDQVKALLRYFESKKWSLISASFERARRYIGMMRAVFREHGLPQDLVNLAFIESAVNPRATSRVKAAGIWQFMPSTGRVYGMRTTAWVDERRDPDKSTRGAARYLKALYQRFDDWPLALAAYNAGEGTVERAIRRQRTRDFWSLRLPKETQLFVPAFMAMTIISRDPERYGFSPPPEEPHQIEIVELRRPTALRAVAQAAGTSVEHIRELNPELLLGSTPKQARYALRIPHGVKAAFEEALAAMPRGKREDWVAHTVRKGDTAAAIARRYGASLQAVLELNELTRPHTLKPGTTVLVPGVMEKGADARAAKLASAGGRGAARHTVRRTDTLKTIAAAHGVSIEDLRRWNGLAQRATLRPGQVLKVTPPEKPVGRSVRQAAAR